MIQIQKSELIHLTLPHSGLFHTGVSPDPKSVRGHPKLFEASVNDLLGGQIPLLFGAPTAVEPLATAGKIKVLGVTSEKRYPLLPNVPAISETFPEFKIISYIGFMLPRNTPKPVIATLNKEVNQILATDSMRAWLDKQG